MTNYHTVIIGGGAAGLMCAALAAKKNKSILIIEHNKQLGRKILISGGGRCNFTNLYTSPKDFVSENPHFHKSALARYSPYDFIDLMLKHKLSYHEKKLGQLFCDQKSRGILNMLVAECLNQDVDILTETTVTSIKKQDSSFNIQTSKKNIISQNLVIATGGLSFPPLGATDFGYQIAKQFQLKIIPPSAALTPLLASGFKSLSGVSLPVSLSLKEKNITIYDDFLFTHKGFSGPATLKISLYWQKGETIILDLLPQKNILKLINDRLKSSHKDHKTLTHLLHTLLPKSLASKWLTDHLPQVTYLDQISKNDLKIIENRLHNFPLNPKASEGYKKAEVTKGGVATCELSSKTMESKKVPGLYFIGEVVDTTGLLGGYNFQWCWACAHACAEAL